MLLPLVIRMPTERVRRGTAVRQLLDDIAQAQGQTNLDQFRQAVLAVQINVLTG